MSTRTQRQLVLIIDSDDAHCVALTAAVRAAGYDARSTPHDSALKLLSTGNPFHAVILSATPQQSTLSPQDHLGEFVLRYMRHVVPALASRTIILTTLPADGEPFRDAFAVLGDPCSEEELLNLLARCVRLTWDPAAP